MKQKQEYIEEYAYKLLKKKNYFIREFYNKLISKYSREDSSKIIKKFILLEILNDKYLVEMKVCYLIHIKLYGKKYIYNYFYNKNISYNLVKYVISKYNDDIFIKNINEIKDKLLSKGKSDIYINNYLERKGYDIT